MDHELTKLQVWIEADSKRRSVEKLTSALKKRLDHVSAAYIQSIVDGYYPPSRKLARLLAEETGVPMGDILTYAYRAPRAA